MPTLNVKVNDETKERVWIEATKVPQRTVSDWLREVVEAALPKPVRKPKK